MAALREISSQLGAIPQNALWAESAAAVGAIDLWSLTPHHIYGLIRHMKAQAVFQVKQAYGAGIVEIVIWQVPQPVPPSGHPYKYRLVYVVNGQRVLGYDNERGKGDHKHVGQHEEPYRFVNPQQLMADFMGDLKEYCDD